MKLHYCILALIAIALVDLAVAQDEEYDENYPDSDDGDDGGRESRQVGYAFEAPSGECIRAWSDFANCGGFRGGNGGSCDRHCLNKGFPKSWCRPNYCLCHRGHDLGKDCEIDYNSRGK